MIDFPTSAPTTLVLGALLSLLPTSAHADAASDTADYRESLVEAARAAQLHERAEWRTLLHYEDGLFGGGSLVDDPAFFAAENGKDDPAAELSATLRAFFDPPPDEGRHPVCRYAARFEWLRTELAIDVTRLPVPRCDEIEDFLAEMQPHTVRLSFPTAYMNSPASMYGHTLLTIETVHDSELLSYAINYAAQTDTSFGPLFAVKGLLGLYPGYYSILPYYAKLQEYSDVNDRDIWEYTLNLQPAEIRRLLLHVYELENVYSDYYFFDENCSFNLLYLLDVARPGTHLAKDAGAWVIPLDTIRLVQEHDMVASVEYRASKSTKIRHLAAQLPDDAQDTALAVARGEAALDTLDAIGDDATTRVIATDLATEYLQYLYFGRTITQDDYAPRLRALAMRRARLGGPDDVDLPPITPPARPDHGHRSSRAAVGGGTVDGRAFGEVSYRAVYHDLIDNRGGYLEGSQIVFGGVDVRFDDEDVWLEHLNLVDIVSLSPRDRFFAPTSWMAQTGWLRRMSADGERALVYDFRYGIGRSYKGSIPGLWYLLVEGDVQFGGALDGNHALGAGGTTGVLRGIGRRGQAHVFARAIRFFTGEEGNTLQAGGAANLETSRNTALRAELTRTGEEDRWWWDASLRLHVFF